MKNMNTSAHASRRTHAVIVPTAGERRWRNSTEPDRFAVEVLAVHTWTGGIIWVTFGRSVHAEVRTVKLSDFNSTFPVARDMSRGG